MSASWRSPRTGATPRRRLTSSRRRSRAASSSGRPGAKPKQAGFGCAILRATQSFQIVRLIFLQLEKGGSRRLALVRLTASVVSDNTMDIAMTLTDEIRAFNRFYTREIGLLNRSLPATDL